MEREPAFPLRAPPHLVIFDCDGVLVDSEKVQNAVLAEVLSRRGVAMTEADVIREFLGLPATAVAERIAASRGVALASDWLAELHEATETAFRRDLRPVPHVRDLILALERAGVAFCVGSNGTVPKMHMSLGLTGLLPHLQGRLFSGEDTPRGKPFPDVFLHAAQVMGAAPGDCVVIEDSTAGLTAARAAGMKALAYVANPAHRPVELYGGHPFDDMRQVPALLGLTGAG
jgi:HAD superfamily hydrolase (TIGR01509 family)